MVKPQPGLGSNPVTRRSLFPLAAGVVLLGIALLIGCSSDEVGSPVPSAVGPAVAPYPMCLQPYTPADPQLNSGEENGGGDGQAVSISMEDISSWLIHRETGGTIKLDHVLLTFAPYCLEQDTVITIIRHPSDPDKIVFELLPHGIEFNLPITLTVNLASTGIGMDEVGTIYWYDPDTAEWVDLNAKWFWPFASVRLDHFSKYGGGRGGW